MKSLRFMKFWWNP